jgi:hypothetical protein
MASLDPEAEIRRQLLAVFERASYPLADPLELVPVLPDGAATTFEAGDVALGAMELGIEYEEYQEYPYDDAEALVDDLMSGLREDGVFE